MKIQHETLWPSCPPLGKIIGDFPCISATRGCQVLLKYCPAIGAAPQPQLHLLVKITPSFFLLLASLTQLMSRLSSSCFLYRALKECL